MKRNPSELAGEWQTRAKKTAKVANQYDVMDDEDAAQQLRLTVQAASLRQCARELLEFIDGE